MANTLISNGTDSKISVSDLDLDESKLSFRSDTVEDGLPVSREGSTLGEDTLPVFRSDADDAILADNLIKQVTTEEHGLQEGGGSPVVQDNEEEGKQKQQHPEQVAQLETAQELVNKVSEQVNNTPKPVTAAKQTVEAAAAAKATIEAAAAAKKTVEATAAAKETLRAAAAEAEEKSAVAIANAFNATALALKSAVNASAQAMSSLKGSLVNKPSADNEPDLLDEVDSNEKKGTTIDNAAAAEYY